MALNPEQKVNYDLVTRYIKNPKKLPKGWTKTEMNALIEEVCGYTTAIKLQIVSLMGGTPLSKHMRQVLGARKKRKGPGVEEGKKSYSGRWRN